MVRQSFAWGSGAFAMIVAVGLPWLTGCGSSPPPPAAVPATTSPTATPTASAATEVPASPAVTPASTARAVLPSDMVPVTQGPQPTPAEVGRVAPKLPSWTQATSWSHPSAVYGLAFGTEPSQLFVLSGPAIHVVNANTGAITKTLTVPGNTFSALAVSPDGKQLLAGGGLLGRPGAVLVWPNWQTSDELIELLGHDSNVTSVAWWGPVAAPIPVSAGTDRTIKVWDVAKKQPVLSVPAHSDYISQLAVSPDRNWLASASGDKSVKLWQSQQRTAQRTLTGQSQFVSCVAFAPDGKLLAGGGGSCTVTLWTLPVGTVAGTLAGHVKVVTGIAFSPDGKWLASAGGDRVVRLWNVEKQSNDALLDGFTDFVNAVSFSPDGKLLAVGTEEGLVKVYQVP